MKLWTHTFVLCETLQRQAMLNTTEPFLTGECEAARELQQFSLGQIHESIRRSLSREYFVFISLTRAFRDKDDICSTIVNKEAGKTMN